MPGGFALTSPTIVEGGDIPRTHACGAKGGMNLSPALDWTNAPMGTMSFAIVFTDLSISGGFLHGAIYDIPSTLSGVPADIDQGYAPTDVPGAHQTPSYQPALRGWNGPCPNSEHTYQLKLYALSAATVPNGAMSTTTASLLMAIAPITLATATLTANFDPN